MSLCTINDQVLQKVRSFWFGPIHNGFSEKCYSDRWFLSNKAFDADVSQQFSHYVEQALQEPIRPATPHNRLALILLLDQFPRNIYRKQAKAFAGDHQALALTKRGIDEGSDGALTFIERLFFYMPLMHSEQLKDQEACIKQIKKLLNDVPESARMPISNSLKFAEEHRDIIEKYGRFPYRNNALKRKNTKEEIEYLKHGTHFGQG